MIRTVRGFVALSILALPQVAFGQAPAPKSPPAPATPTPVAPAETKPSAPAPEAEKAPETTEKPPGQPAEAGTSKAEEPAPHEGTQEGGAAATVTPAAAAAPAGAAPAAAPAPASAPQEQPAASSTNEVQKTSASANQKAEIPADDYDGASDAALAEEPKGPKNLSLGIALDVTMPLAKSADFISSASIQGLSLDLRYYAWGNIGIGAGVALDSLSKKSTSTIVWENATITGTQVRELSYTPVLAKGYYAWRDQEKFVPYVAAGLGAARVVRRVVVGYSSLSEASWHFAVVPEAGLQIPVGPTVLLTNVRLNYLPPSGGVEEQFLANLSFGISVQ